MLFRDFDYNLPQELIAQNPTDRRDASRLMIVDRGTGTAADSVFSDIRDCFRPGDLLVLNDTRVIPARLHGTKESGGRVEVFLARKLDSPGETWECLIKSSKRPRPGTVIRFSAAMSAEVVDRSGDETWTVSFSPADGFGQWLEEYGKMPLPPYIRRMTLPEDIRRYQTVFARVSGAVAAPTAGLHFTEELLGEIVKRGVEIKSLTLHVGLGTFLPVRVEAVHEHRMHREYYSIPGDTADAVSKRKKGSGRVVALGTTTARALEHSAAATGSVAAGAGEADIFIYPGYQFKAVDALITNFHLPKSTLLLLVAAFAGKDLLLRAYEDAVHRRYRFFSYGDAMFIQ